MVGLNEKSNVRAIVGWLRLQGHHPDKEFGWSRPILFYFDWKSFGGFDNITQLNEKDYTSDNLNLVSSQLKVFLVVGGDMWWKGGGCVGNDNALVVVSVTGDSCCYC